MADDLVEIAAPLLCENLDCCEETCWLCAQQARAVIAAVEPVIRAAALEEAAKEAEFHAVEGEHADCEGCGELIAAAIRKLAKKEAGDEQ